MLTEYLLRLKRYDFSDFVIFEMCMFVNMCSKYGATHKRKRTKLQVLSACIRARL